MAVEVRRGPNGLSIGKPRILFKPPPTYGPVRSAYVVSPDGQRFLFVKELTSGSANPIVVVTNWLGSRN
jgi:hypothetical protein